MEPIIEVKNVTKIYKVGTERITALDNVSFTINKGDFCCLLGSSGSGKSTLLNLMAGIEKITKGEILIKGKDVCKMGEHQLAKFRQKYLGFVFQSYNLLPALNAIENVALPMVFKEVKAKERTRRAKEMLIADEIIDTLGIRTKLETLPSALSGGQQQRVGIARAFVTDPEIVFADEPTGNLDSKTANEIMEIIKKIATERKQTIVMVTHDVNMAKYANKIVHIHDGHIEKIVEVNENEKNN